MADIIRIKVPPRFIRDCLDSDCDVGTYERGHLIATHEQLAELINRAQHYAGDGVDMAPVGLVRSAKATLQAVSLHTEQVPV